MDPWETDGLVLAQAALSELGGCSYGLEAICEGQGDVLEGPFLLGPPSPCQTLMAALSPEELWLWAWRSWSCGPEAQMPILGIRTSCAPAGRSLPPASFAGLGFSIHSPRMH